MTDAFSWTQAKKNSEITKLRRAHTQIKAKHPDLAKLHPAWIKEYTTVGKFTEADIAIKKDIKDKQEQSLIHREKVKTS